MDEKILEEIGLTSGEIKVYLALLEIGESRTGEIAKEAGVSSSKVYKILDRLEKKGLVGESTKSKTRYFLAMKPQRIINYVEEKEKDLNEKKEKIRKMLPEFEKYQKLQETENILFEGFRAVTNLFRNILDELKKGENYYVIGAGYGETPALRDFFQNYHSQRSEKGIKIKMLANLDIEKNIEPSTKKNSEIKFLPKYLITNMEIVFYQDKAFIILWTKRPTAMYIKNKEAVKSFQSYFDAFWKIAKK